jgi:hypothetical protein
MTMARGFMRPILESMGRGSFFRQVIASVMRVLGVVGLIVAGVGCVVAIVTGFEASGANGIAYGPQSSLENPRVPL